MTVTGTISRRNFIRCGVAGATMIGGVALDPLRLFAAVDDAGGEEEIRDGLSNGVFSHGSRRASRIALSFDACPTTAVPPFAADVVEFLETDRVAATFFVSGRWAEANPDYFLRLAGNRDFEIGLHGYHHPRFADASAEIVRAEIEQGREALIRLGASPVALFRPPYFEVPPSLDAVARETGILPVLGDAGLGDPDPDRTADLLERDAIRWVQAGSVIVLHVNGRGHATAPCVRDLVPAFRERGYEFVTVSALVRDSGLALPR